MNRHQHWRDLTPSRRRAFLSASIVQIALAAAAWTDLAGRPKERLRGRKPLWALAIAVNFVGPIAYLCFGRTHGSISDGDGSPGKEGPDAL